MPRAEINGAKLNYELSGDGPAVVLVHSTVCDMRMWDEHVEPLAREFRVLRYDLRGYGGSTLPPGPFSHGRDLLALLDVVGIARAAFVGASGGGRVALDAAALGPDRVTALALVDCALRDHEWSAAVRTLWEEEERLLDEGDIDAATELNVRLWVDGLGRGPDAVDDAVRERVRGMQRQAFALQAAAHADGQQPGPEEAVELRLSEIEAPALILVGGRDVPDFLEIAEHLRAELPNARRVTIEGVAHFPSLERPDEFRAIALEFLREHAGF